MSGEIGVWRSENGMDILVLRFDGGHDLYYSMALSGDCSDKWLQDK